MSALESVVLRVHVAAGVIAFVAGVRALVTAKGGRRHRQSGKGFVLSMAVVVGTVPPILAFDPTDFFRQSLLLVAVFSGYLAFSGYRVLSRQRPTGRATPVDWVAVGVVVVASAGLAVMGGAILVGGNSYGVATIVFGLIGASFGLADVRAFVVDEGGERVVNHLTRMIGAFIATVTAVSVVNLGVLPDVVTWLWPTAAGVPLIAYWQRTYGSD